MPNAAEDNAPSTANPPSAKKGKNDTTVPATALRDIRNAAAFLALVNVYGQGITGEKAMEKEMAKHFFGDDSSGLASTLKLVLSGGAAFEDLFEDVTTDDGTDCILKKHCHGTNSYIVRGEHFDEDLLSRQAFTKPGSVKMADLQNQGHPSHHPNHFVECLVHPMPYPIHRFQVASCVEHNRSTRPDQQPPHLLP